MTLTEALQAALAADAAYTQAASIYVADLANGSPQPKTTNDLAAANNALTTLCGSKQAITDGFAGLGC